MAQNNKNIDMPIQEVKTPILAPVKIKKSKYSEKEIIRKINELKIIREKTELREKLSRIVKKDPNQTETTPFDEFLKYINKIYGDNFIKTKDQAMRGFLTSYKIENKEIIGPQVFFNRWKTQILHLLKTSEKPIKARMILEVEFIKGFKKSFAYFHTDNKIITESTYLNKLYKEMVELLLEKLMEFQLEGSGWMLKGIIQLDIHIDKYKPLNGRSFIPLPKELANKKAIINVKN